ncbi:hypothetical protein [Paenibacillus dendritiformis]|uniref:hypothetical protein n=1 Tax=Paenibacillus dendritiformis TaxID=130049 RepID=UPI00387E1A67
MHKLKVFPKDDLTMFPHTWTKGLDYELIQKNDYFTLASNEGQTNIVGSAKERLSETFDFEKH